MHCEVMKYHSGIFVLLATMVIICTPSNAGKYSGDKLLRILPATELQVKLLVNLVENEPQRYDFWQLPARVGKAVDIHVKAQDAGNFSVFLNNTKMSYEVLQDDLQSLLDQQHDHPHYADASGLEWYLKYHRLNEIEEKIKDIVKSHSRASLVDSIGTTYEGRKQLAVKIEGAPKKHNPVFFINCGIHAREWVGPATCVYIIEQLASQYGKDVTVTKTLDKIDFIILPVFNGDGYEYSWTENRMWRKNRHPLAIENKTACVGVDLNRNFPYKWGQDVEGASSTDPCSEIYRGPYAESEPEVKNVVNYLRALSKNLKAYIDIHSYSQLWMMPWGFTKDPPNDYQELKKVGKAGVEGIKAAMKQSYRLGSSSKLLYKTSGTTKDFTYGELGVKYSYVLELRDEGNKGFILPDSEILPTAIETFAGIKAMVAEMEDYSHEF